MGMRLNICWIAMEEKRCQGCARHRGAVVYEMAISKLSWMPDCWPKYFKKFCDKRGWTVEEAL